MSNLNTLFKQAGVEISLEQQQLFVELMRHCIQESCVYYDPDSDYLADYIISRLLEN